jgi:RHS repeat-associated protein
MGALPQYNGNISAIQWRTPGGTGAISTSIQGYAYAYDGMNRMLTATYAQGATGTVNKNLYNESVGGYDLNGNILSLTRRKAGVVEDNLTYTYQGNRLTSVNDAANDNVLFTEVSQSGVEYEYDNNGNMTKDLNRRAGVKYNVLNLPSEVYNLDTLQNKIQYIYSATGAKLAKEANVAGTIEKRYYAGSFEYDKDKNLRLIHTPEGQVEVEGQGASRTFAYTYYLKDHLGNTRVMFDGDGDVTQVADYYPFGGRHTPATLGGSNKYLYNGKEVQEELGLGWYDYGARFYDPQIARWHVKDPLMEWHFSQTPYHYCLNNPINFTDPFGLDTLRVNSDGVPEADIAPVTIKGERPSWVVRTLRRIGRALATSDDAFSGTPPDYIEKTVERGYNWWLPDSKDPMGIRNVISRDNPDRDKYLRSEKQSTGQRESSTSRPRGTTDREIKDATGDNTDASGKPINESDYFIPTTLPEGTHIPTRNGSEPYQKGDTLYLDSIPKGGTTEGYRGYYKYWRIQNANRKK